MAKTEPSVDQWLREAKADPAAAQCGMFLTHNGIEEKGTHQELMEKRGIYYHLYSSYADDKTLPPESEA